MFQLIYEHWHKEQTSQNIQSIPDNFYPNSTLFLKKLREDLEAPGLEALGRKILSHQLAQAESMLEELKKIRLEKISLAAAGVTTLRKEDLSREELRLYDELRQSMEEYRREIQKPPEEPEAGRKILVRFLEEVPEFVGVDLISYGPFRAEDVSAIPIENATQLIKKNYAMEIEEGN